MESSRGSAALSFGFALTLVGAFFAGLGLGLGIDIPEGPNWSITICGVGILACGLFFVMDGESPNGESGDRRSPGRNTIMRRR
jgi:hypothetical protein